MNAKPTDNELIALYKKGDVVAFETIYDRYRNLIKAIVRPFFLVGGDSDDLIQEGFLGLLKAVNTYDESKLATFSSFAYTCISSSVKTAVKRDLSKKNLPLNSAISIEGLEIVSIDDPESQVIRSELSKELSQRLKSELSAFEFKILKLWLGGASYAEISEQIGKPAKSVDNAVQRIKKKLNLS